jgi:N-acetyltransferase 10
MPSLDQLFTRLLDFSRFNERFILSLASNKRCVVIDDNLNVLPLSSHIKHVTEVPPKSSENCTPEEAELKDVREKFQDSQPTVRF